LNWAKKELCVRGWREREGFLLLDASSASTFTCRAVTVMRWCERGDSNDGGVMVRVMVEEMVGVVLRVMVTVQERMKRMMLKILV
jgi:hypothetical protein